MIVWTSDGAVFSVGRNHRGQLGNGTTTDTNTFQPLNLSLLPGTGGDKGLKVFGARCGATHSIIMVSDEEILNMGFFVHLEDEIEFDSPHQLAANSTWKEDISNMSFTRGRSVHSRSFAAGASRRASTAVSPNSNNKRRSTAAPSAHNSNTPPWYLSNWSMGVGAVVSILALVALSSKKVSS